MNSKNYTAAKQQFSAFVRDDGDLSTLREFAVAQGWNDSCVMQGDISTAASYLKSNASPAVLLVEIPSAQEADALLDELANVCDPGTKVIVTGNVNEYSFYCRLTDIGIFSYLLRPLTKESLEIAYKKSQDILQGAVAQEKEQTKIISVVGARGGVGASTIALNLAGIFGEYSDKKVALVDLDPRAGTLSLMLDIEPSRGLRDALEKPERIDQLFIDRVMNNVGKNLWVMSAEEPLKENIKIGDSTAEALLRELSNKYDVLVLDVPRHFENFERECLKMSHDVLLVAELSLQSLRDTLRISDVLTDSLKLAAPTVIANRVGASPKAEMSVADFEKGITAKIAEKIPYNQDVFMYIGDEIPSVIHSKNAAVKPLISLAKQLLPSLQIEEEKKEGDIFSFFKKKEK